MKALPFTKPLWQRLFPNMTFVPVPQAHGYPLDLAGFEDFTRPRTGRDRWPTHSNADNFPLLGDIRAMIPLSNAFVWSQAYGMVPEGPIMNPLPPSINSNINVAALPKTGTSS